MEIYNVVKKLVGSIEPIGDTKIDNERFENLKTMCNLVDKLLTDIDTIAYNYKDSKQSSLKRASEYADSFQISIGIN